MFTADAAFVHVFRRAACGAFVHQLAINVELELILFGIAGVNDVIPVICLGVKANLDTVVFMHLNLVAFKLEMDFPGGPLPRGDDALDAAKLALQGPALNRHLLKRTERGDFNVVLRIAFKLHCIPHRAFDELEFAHHLGIVLAEGILDGFAIQISLIERIHGDEAVGDEVLCICRGDAKCCQEQAERTDCDIPIHFHSPSDCQKVKFEYSLTHCMQDVK